MNEFEILQRAGLAVAIGLLIGIERGWQARQAKDGSRVAGIRTFTLIGGLGGIWACVWPALPFPSASSNGDAHARRTTSPQPASSPAL